MPRYFGFSLSTEDRTEIDRCSPIVYEGVPRQTFTIGCIGLLGRRAPKALIFHVLRSRFSFVAKA